MGAFKERYYEEKERRIRRYCMDFSARRIQRQYKRYGERKGYMRVQKRYMKMCFSMVGFFHEEKSIQKSKSLIMNFFKFNVAN